jgi:MFS family permease
MKIPAIQFSIFASIFASIVFVPLFASELGASEFEIGIVVAGYGIAAFVASALFGRIADMYGRRRLIQIGFLAASIAMALQIIPGNWQSLLFIRILVGICIGIFPGALTAYAFESGMKMGKFASYGSLGFGIGAFIAGFAAFTWYWREKTASIFIPIFGASAILFIICFFISLKLPFVRDVKMKVPLLPLKVIKNNFPAYMSVLLRHTGACAIWLIFPLFIASLQPFSSKGEAFFWVGAVHAANGVGQFLFMQFLDKYRSTALLTAGFAVSACVFLSFTLCTNVWQLLLTQIPLAFSWACMYVGALKYVVERNIERATSTGLLQSTISLASVIGPLIGGALAGFVVAVSNNVLEGYKSTMYFAAGMAVTALVLFRLHFFRKKCAKN